MIGKNLKSPMRKGQLIKAVLKAYKHHIKYIRENFKEDQLGEVDYYLTDHSISHGICLFINKNTYYRYGGYRAKWVEKYYTEYSSKWGQYPTSALSVEKVLENLELRVRIMEQELASGDNLHQRITSKNYFK